MILQLNPTIDVLTTKGEAEAIMIIDYGVNVNTVWLCRMKGGKVLHFYSDDIRMYGNPMNGKGWDVIADFEETKKEDDTTDVGFAARVMALEKRVEDVYKDLNEPDLPRGEEDIVLDFSKEEQPKTS